METEKQVRKDQKAITQDKPQTLTDDDENFPCYCLDCNWHGLEDELAEVGKFSVCPVCGSEKIVYIE